MSDEKTIVSPNEDFIVSVNVDDSGDETVIVTSFDESLEKYENQVLMSAIKDYDRTKGQYSAYLSDKSSGDTLTPEFIDELADGIHSDLKKVMSANALVRKSIITDDIIGKTYESIESNVNTEFKLSFGNYAEKRNKSKKLNTAKNAVAMFNKQINLKQLIRNSIPLTYAEGTYILCLRYDGSSSYVVDHYPLGVAFVSEYDYAGKPVVCIDIKELENRLKKTYSKDKRNKAKFFENIEKDIKANYPKEVYDAYKRKESDIRLDTKYTRVMRIGNMGRRYGVSPIVRALKSSLMLQNFENSDFINAKAKAKKIIHQVMRKETMGVDYSRRGFEYAIHAHEELCSAWKNKTVIYTSIPQVEKVLYIEPKTDDTNSDKINICRSKIMTTLGIGFVDTNVANFSVANISLDQLLKTINSISEQLEGIVQDWYEVLFENEGIDKEYLPTIQILDSEQMSIDMKKDLVELLYSKLNCSLSTALEVIGYDIRDETAKRIAENEEKLDEIFTPHGSQYTGSVGKSVVGAPESNPDTAKQVYDKDYRDKRNGE